MGLIMLSISLQALSEWTKQKKKVKKQKTKKTGGAWGYYRTGGAHGGIKLGEVREIFRFEILGSITH